MTASCPRRGRRAMADRGTSFDRALAIVTAFEAAGETSAARMLLLTQIQDLIDAADAARAGASNGDIIMDEQFFIVWNPNGMGPTRYRHETVDSARKEAIRLGTENPGQTFHVLENIGHAKTPAAVFTSVFPVQLNIADVNLGMVTAGAATGRAVVFESTPNPSGDDTWTQFGRHRGPTLIIADAEYIPGVKSRDGDPAADTLERARAEVIRLRKWISRIDDCACRSGAMTYEQRQIIAWACRQALGHQPIPEGNHGLPGFDEAASGEVEDKPYRILVHGMYRPGDHVRYTGRGPGRFHPSLLGAIGVFREEGDSGFCAVDFDADSGAAPNIATHVNNLEHETLPQFEVGDTVRIVGSPHTGREGEVHALIQNRLFISVGIEGYGVVDYVTRDISLLRPVQHRHRAR